MMKNIFDTTTRNELIQRINRLNEDNRAQWGRMNVFQMLKHCTLWEEMVQGKRKFRRVFLGRFFGRMSLKRMIGDESELKRNIPTLMELRVRETGGNVEAEKTKWIDLIRQYEQFSQPGFVHPFCGKMTKKQVGLLAYKHTDHHLRQSMSNSSQK